MSERSHVSSSASLASRLARLRVPLGFLSAVVVVWLAQPTRTTLVVGGVAGSGTRYVYNFDPANANAYAAFVCVAGRVTGVERFMTGQ